MQPWKTSILAVVYDATHHLLHGQREMEKDEEPHEASQEHISQSAPEDNVPSAKRQRCSAESECKMPVCHFGHRTTSHRGSDGKTKWHVNPVVSFWIGKVPGGVTLCSRCYQAGYKAVNTKKVTFAYRGTRLQS